MQIGIVRLGDDYARPKKPGAHAGVAAPPIRRFVGVALLEDSAGAVKQQMGKEPSMARDRRALGR